MNACPLVSHNLDARGNLFALKRQSSKAIYVFDLGVAQF